MGSKAPYAWRKDTTREKEAERCRDESDPEDGFKLREKITGGRKTFGLVVGKDDDYDEIDMSIEEDERLCLINKLKMEDQDMHESLDKLDRRINRIEEKAPGSAKHIGFCNATWIRWMKISLKGWRLTIYMYLFSSYAKKILEVRKNYIALLEKLAKERSARIIYLKAFTVDQDPYA
jgi:hypothetical protein